MIFECANFQLKLTALVIVYKDMLFLLLKMCTKLG